MHGQGRFFDPRLNDAATFPIAAKSGMGNIMPVNVGADTVTSKLAALHFYQLALPIPTQERNRFDFRVPRGQALFNGKAKCATCHTPPLFSEPGWNMHTPAESRMDDFQANRSPDKRYRTSPLKGLFTHTKGDFFHDGRAATLRDVVDLYDSCISLALTDAEKEDLVAFLMVLEPDRNVHRVELVHLLYLEFGE